MIIIIIIKRKDPAAVIAVLFPLQGQEEDVLWWTCKTTVPYCLCDPVVFLLPVHPVAPANLTAVAHAWNATLQWDWEYATYAPFALVCQVEITLDGHVKKVTVRFVALAGPFSAQEIQTLCRLHLLCCPVAALIVEI